MIKTKEPKNTETNIIFICHFSHSQQCGQILFELHLKSNPNASYRIVASSNGRY